MRLPLNTRARGRRYAVPLLVTLAVATAPALLPGVASGAKTPTELARFGTPGLTTWTVPKGVSQVTFDVFGASGGKSGTNLAGGAGGKGGEATATIAVQPGQVFVIVVGGQGSDGSALFAGGGGSNGGASGGFALSAAFPPPTIFGGGGGGGASDVRFCASPTTGCTFSDRIVVGGGGGGNGTGGTGGGASGGAGSGGSGGTPGTQQGAGIFDGAFASGGPGGNSTCASGGACGGGGGGGWLGGGGGNNAGGGGGSGFVSPLALNGSLTNDVQAGNGLVVITSPR